MIEEIFINQNEDVDLLIEVFQKDGTTPLPMNTAMSIYVIIHDGYKAPWAKFTASAAGGDWLPLDITNAATGVLGAKVFSDVTKAMRPGKYYMEIAVRYSDINATDDNLYDIVESKQYCFSIKESLTFTLAPLP